MNPPSPRECGLLHEGTACLNHKSRTAWRLTRQETTRGPGRCPANHAKVWGHIHCLSPCTCLEFLTRGGHSTIIMVMETKPPFVLVYADEVKQHLRSIEAKYHS